MQHQYWVTKKSVLRKLGGKEDDCIVSSDAELDAKLELFKSINESCTHLQRVIDLYQERLCYLAQEENALGRYLKECGKHEKNSCAGQIMLTAGKALAYAGHQRLTVRPPLVRLHHEVETFRGRAVTDTRATVSEMEKARTEYRAALSWMKSVSSQLDPDSGHGLERFRKAQSYVKSTKMKFDRLTLACLQKVDLLAAARCNMFSHALVPYQNVIKGFSTKVGETLCLAAEKLSEAQPYEFNAVTELATTSETDKDKSTFFNAEYTDNVTSDNTESEMNASRISEDETSETIDLLGENFAASKNQEPEQKIEEDVKPSSELLDLNWATNLEFFGNDFMPSKLMQDTYDFTDTNLNKDDKKGDGKTESRDTKKLNADHVSWLSLFAELDPLANSPAGHNVAGDRV
ncbi:hypothetical protein NQ315_004593 [Exocentrus adspersus]|uniref:AH domain-containing protein n=1 Tax=Exocentrus adspersus TaxID=1586481 RepID=A0AAV8VN16_9CUCU|nr:hypothetical protein NQ315_004593 [Exocentrus adspersus]